MRAWTDGDFANFIVSDVGCTDSLFFAGLLVADVGQCLRLAEFSAGRIGHDEARRGDY